MIPSKVFRLVGGLDEKFQIAFNDVDMCMRIKKAGYLIVFTPYAELYHYESKSRGSEDTYQKVKRFNSEVERFQKRWNRELSQGDPYYNPNLTLKKENFSYKTKK
jgi:GT2 family glycosyltransferase